MPVPRRLSLAGCKSRDEALERLRLWLHAIHADSIGALQTDLICTCDGDDLDPDYLDAQIDFVKAEQAQAREDALQYFQELFDAHNIGPA